jgi:hypothetical protein
MCIRLLAIVSLMLAVPATAAAQEHQCACCVNGAHSDVAGGPHAGAGPAPEYNVATEGLIAGVIYSVMRHAGMDVALTVGAGERTFEILVAPTAWLDRLGAAFRPGDRVMVTGARIDRGSGETFVAREIQSGGQTVVIRDADGRPLWNQP